MALVPIGSPDINNQFRDDGPNGRIKHDPNVSVDTQTGVLWHRNGHVAGYATTDEMDGISRVARDKGWDPLGPEDAFARQMEMQQQSFEMWSELLKPSAEEQRLMELQLEAAEANIRRNRERDAAFGKMLSGEPFKPTTLGEAEAYLAYEIGRGQLLQTKMYTKALKGELPLTKSTERAIEKGREQVDTAVIQRLGPGGETSTPGLEMKQRFEESAAIAAQAEQHGQYGMGLPTLASSSKTLLEPISPVDFTASRNQRSGAAGLALQGSNLPVTSPTTLYALGPEVDDGQEFDWMLPLTMGAQGASTGAQVGGPWGALIGGVAGAGAGTGVQFL